MELLLAIPIAVPFFVLLTLLVRRRRRKI